MQKFIEVDTNNTNFKTSNFTLKREIIIFMSERKKQGKN